MLQIVHCAEHIHSCHAPFSIVHAARGHLVSSRSCLSFSMSSSSVFFCFSSLPEASSTLGCTMGVRSESARRLQQQVPIVCARTNDSGCTRARRQLHPCACAVLTLAVLARLQILKPLFLLSVTMIWRLFQIAVERAAPVMKKCLKRSPYKQVKEFCIVFQANSFI